MAGPRRRRPKPGICPGSDPGGTAQPAHVFLKDLGYIDAECRRLGIVAPLIGPTLDWYARLVEAGRGQDEGAAIYDLLKDAQASS